MYAKPYRAAITRTPDPPPGMRFYVTSHLHLMNNLLSSFLVCFHVPAHPSQEDEAIACSDVFWNEELGSLYDTAVAATSTT